MVVNGTPQPWALCVCPIVTMIRIIVTLLAPRRYDQHMIPEKHLSAAGAIAGLDSTGFLPMSAPGALLAPYGYATIDRKTREVLCPVHLELATFHTTVLSSQRLIDSTSAGPEF